MNNTRPSLKNALESVKLLSKCKGQEVSEKDIAAKMNLSYEQFELYLLNESSVPENFVQDLLSAYGLKQIISKATGYYSLKLLRHPGRINPEDESSKK